ncbi:MAG: hypothetical protein ACRDHF_02455 [Tepidiformaceae bacterium]
MERERARYLAQTLGSALLSIAGVLLGVGLFGLWRLGAQVDGRFGFGSDSGPNFDDYLLVLWPYAMYLVTAVGIIGGLGLYFRWQAVEQDAKMVEFETLLDALGVPVNDDPEEARPDA